MKRKGTKRTIRHVQYDWYPNPYDPYFLPYPRFPNRWYSNFDICVTERKRCQRRCSFMTGYENVLCNQRCEEEFVDCQEIYRED